MSTRAQRLRVAELLDGLASQNDLLYGMGSLLIGADRSLAEAAHAKAFYEHADDGDWSWRDFYAEAAQLLREGSVK